MYESGIHALTAHNDFYLEACTDNGKYTFVNIIYHANAQMAWCSRRIKTVVKSTQATDYITLSNTGHDLQ